MEKTEIINKTEKPHSFEIGKAHKRHKIYYGDIDDLRKHILELEALGLVDLEACEIDLKKLEGNPEARMVSDDLRKIKVIKVSGKEERK